MVHILRRWIASMLVALAVPAGAAAPPAAAAGSPELWRLDCGSVFVPDLDFLSDSFAFSGRSRTVAVSCYLIRHQGRYLLWDAGLPLSRLGEGVVSVGGGRARLERSIVDQLKQLGITSAQVTLVALSHYHSDHSGQAASFPNATLWIGAADMAVVRSSAPAFNLVRDEFEPWTRGGGKVEEVTGDRDLFGDGKVVMLATPGHTPGHHSLLVRLAGGPVLLSGDLWHFAEQKTENGVPKINTSRADTLASMDRIEKVAQAIGATIVIGHEADEIGKLPAFPEASR